MVAVILGLATWLSTGFMSTLAYPDYQHLTEDVALQKLFSLAMDARTNSYSPYSKFRVGACLLTPDGEYIPGTQTQSMLERYPMRLTKPRTDPIPLVPKKAAMWRMRPTD